MNKIAEFYTKAMADESAKAELEAVIGGKNISELSDEELLKIGKIAEKLGFAITLDEAKSYFAGEGEEISDDELDKVSGGSRYYTYDPYDPEHDDPEIYLHDKSKKM